MLVRPETETDHGAVRAINTAAFDTDAEARLVDLLRERAHPLVSLVADDGGAVVGHILFTPATLDSRPDLTLMGLAPMAVTPDRQRGGIGGALVRAGLAACREVGAGAVVVLGHPTYYPRFGFAPAGARGLRCEYDAPPEAFMALELAAGTLDGASGVVRYHPAFAEL